MPIRLGGPVWEPYDSPESWVTAVRRAGWRATTCPVGLDADADTLAAYREAAAEADILISEVGAWSNPISPDPTAKEEAIAKCKAAMRVGDALGANCVVTIAGSKGSGWDRAHPDNFSAATFREIVAAVREILAETDPQHTCFTLEAMPWVFPDSPDVYLEIVEAVGHPKFAVHLDPINMICTPRRALDNTAFLNECFDKLGPHIRNIHAKDSKIGPDLTFQVREVVPGEGLLDYATFLRRAAALPQDIGFILEHLETWTEYEQAARFVREVGSQQGIEL